MQAEGWHRLFSDFQTLERFQGPGWSVCAQQLLQNVEGDDSNSSKLLKFLLQLFLAKTTAPQNFGRQQHLQLLLLPNNQDSYEKHCFESANVDEQFFLFLASCLQQQQQQTTTSLGSNTASVAPKHAYKRQRRHQLQQEAACQVVFLCMTVHNASRPHVRYRSMLLLWHVWLAVFQQQPRSIKLLEERFLAASDRADPFFSSVEQQQQQQPTTTQFPRFSGHSPLVLDSFKKSLEKMLLMRLVDINENVRAVTIALANVMLGCLGLQENDDDDGVPMLAARGVLARCWERMTVDSCVAVRRVAVATCPLHLVTPSSRTIVTAAAAAACPPDCPMHQQLLQLVLNRCMDNSFAVRQELILRLQPWANVLTATQLSGVLSSAFCLGADHRRPRELAAKLLQKRYATESKQRCHCWFCLLHSFVDELLHQPPPVSNRSQHSDKAQREQQEAEAVAISRLHVLQVQLTEESLPHHYVATPPPPPSTTVVAQRCALLNGGFRAAAGSGVDITRLLHSTAEMGARNPWPLQKLLTEIVGYHCSAKKQRLCQRFWLGLTTSSSQNEQHSGDLCPQEHQLHRCKTQLLVLAAFLENVKAQSSLSATELVLLSHNVLQTLPLPHPFVQQQQSIHLLNCYQQCVAHAIRCLCLLLTAHASAFWHSKTTLHLPDAQSSVDARLEVLLQWLNWMVRWAEFFCQHVTQQSHVVVRSTTTASSPTLLLLLLAKDMWLSWSDGVVTLLQGLRRFEENCTTAAAEQQQLMEELLDEHIKPFFERLYDAAVGRNQASECWQPLLEHLVEQTELCQEIQHLLQLSLEAPSFQSILMRARNTTRCGSSAAAAHSATPLCQLLDGVLLAGDSLERVLQEWLWPELCRFTHQEKFDVTQFFQRPERDSHLANERLQTALFAFMELIGKLVHNRQSENQTDSLFSVHKGALMMLWLYWSFAETQQQQRQPFTEAAAVYTTDSPSTATTATPQSSPSVIQAPELSVHVQHRQNRQQNQFYQNYFQRCIGLARAVVRHNSAYFENMQLLLILWCVEWLEYNYRLLFQQQRQQQQRHSSSSTGGNTSRKRQKLSSDVEKQSSWSLSGKGSCALSLEWIKNTLLGELRQVFDVGRGEFSLDELLLLVECIFRFFYLFGDAWAAELMDVVLHSFWTQSLVEQEKKQQQQQQSQSTRPVATDQPATAELLQSILFYGQHAAMTLQDAHSRQLLHQMNWAVQRLLFTQFKVAQHRLKIMAATARTVTTGREFADLLDAEAHRFLGDKRLHLFCVARRQQQSQSSSSDNMMMLYLCFGTSVASCLEASYIAKVFPSPPSPSPPRMSSIDQSQSMESLFQAFCEDDDV